MVRGLNRRRRRRIHWKDSSGSPGRNPLVPGVTILDVSESFFKATLAEEMVEAGRQLAGLRLVERGDRQRDRLERIEMGLRLSIAPRMISNDLDTASQEVG